MLGWCSRSLLGGILNIISCGGAVLGGAEFAGFIGWGFEGFFIICVWVCVLQRVGIF